MKQIILIASIIAVTCPPAFAGNGITSSSNGSAIRAGRIELASKITEFQNNITASPASTASKQSAADLLVILRRGIVQTNNALNLASRDKQSAINTRYLKLEQSSHQFYLLSNDVAGNSTLLLKHANDFKADY